MGVVKQMLLRASCALAGLSLLLAAPLPGRAATGPGAAFPAVRADKPPALDPTLTD